MFSDTLPSSTLRKILITILFVVLLTGCGSNISSTAIVSTPIVNQGMTKASTVIVSTSNINQGMITSLNKAPVSIDIAGLAIYSIEGIQCPLGIKPPSIIITPSDQLVLAATRLTYTQDEIQQMTQYFDSMYTSGKTTSSFLTSPPATLRWVSGGRFCSGDFQITNTGNAPIQISRVGAHITRKPLQNNYQYHTIDACTILSPADQNRTPCPGSSGGGACDGYSAIIYLQHATANSIFTATPTAPAGCPEMTINPNATIDLVVSFVSASSLIYSAIPEFTVSDANGAHVVSLPQLTSTLAFAQDSQFSCFRLQGATFVLEHRPGFCL